MSTHAKQVSASYNILTFRKDGNPFAIYKSSTEQGTIPININDTSPFGGCVLRIRESRRK